MSEAGPRQAGPLQVARAVFWSFFGVRRKADHQRDAVTIRPHQVVIAGLIGGVLFVLMLVFVVKLIVSAH